MCFSSRGSAGRSQNSYWCLEADEDRRDAGWRSKGHHNLLLLPAFASLAWGCPAQLLPYLLGVKFRPRSGREEASLRKPSSTGTLQWPSDCPLWVILAMTAAFLGPPFPSELLQGSILTTKRWVLAHEERKTSPEAAWLGEMRITHQEEVKDPASNKCQRGCGERVSLLHCWWERKL